MKKSVVDHETVVVLKAIQRGEINDLWRVVKILKSATSQLADAIVEAGEYINEETEKLRAEPVTEGNLDAIWQRFFKLREKAAFLSRATIEIFKGILSRVP